MFVLISACLLGVTCRYDGQSRPLSPLPASTEKITFIPVCPEQLGGLPTPRVPAERCGEKVLRQDGDDVTAAYQRGAAEALRIARLYGCRYAVLKEKSPSCGCGNIYDGSFSQTLTDGNGVTADLLLQNGIKVIGETALNDFLREFGNAPAANGEK